MILPSEGRYVHCGVCNGPMYVRYPLRDDYYEYCAKCRWLPQLNNDDLLDMHETLEAITLMGTFMRMLGQGRIE